MTQQNEHSITTAQELLLEQLRHQTYKYADSYKSVEIYHNVNITFIL